MILGLCGPKYSGKSTLAEQIENYCPNPICRIPLANSIKEMEEALLRIQGVSEEEIERLVWIDKEEETEYLNGRSSRYFQTTIGTEWGRNIMDNDLWIGVWERQLKFLRATGKENFIIEDLRFLNEAKMIRHYNGKIIRIERDGYGPSQHLSEQEYLLIQPNLTILNDSTPENLLQKILPHLIQWMQEEQI